LILALEWHGPVQRNIEFSAQGQCFVDVALVASIWVLQSLTLLNPGSIDLGDQPSDLARPGWLDLLVNESPNA